MKDMVDIDKALKNVTSKGNIDMGIKETKKAMADDKAKMVVIASNCPEAADIKQLAEQKNIPFFEYDGKGIELGYACGKPFNISAFAVLDPGRSDIMKLVK